MSKRKHWGLALLLSSTLCLLVACAPVGSERWCEKMDEKPKGDWTANEAADYAKYCIFGFDPDADTEESQTGE